MNYFCTVINNTHTHKTKAMKLKTVRGTYGGSRTPTDVFVAHQSNGGKWYVAKGSVNVNYTYDEIEDGVDIEQLRDDDTCTASKPINSEEDLEKCLSGDDDEQETNDDGEETE